MKIVFFVTTLDIGGAEVLLLDIIRKLISANEIHVLYLKGEDTLVPALQELGIEPVRFKPRSLTELARLPGKLSAILKGKDKFILQGWMYHGNVLAAFVHAFAPKHSSLFWGIHHSAADYPPGPNLAYLMLRLSGLISHLPHNTVYVAEHIRLEHIKRGFSAKKATTINNGVDPDKFRFNGDDRRNIRNELSIPADGFVIGGIGRNHPVKDYSTFFKGMAILLGRFPKLHVVVAGRGFELSEFAAELAHLGQSEMSRIHLLGERSDIPSVLSAIDVFVLSSLSESFSLAVIEALATERCCVCTDVVVIHEDFPEAMKIFVPGHYHDLAEHVCSFMAMAPEKREAIGKASRNIVSDLYSQEKMVKSYAQMWDLARDKPADRPKRKIIRIISRLNIGGPVIHVTLLNKHFNNATWQSILVAGQHSENEGDMSYLAGQYNVKPIFLRGLGREISPLEDLHVLLQLIQLFRTQKPDIVHTHTAKAGTLGRLAALLTGVPRVYHTFHGHVFEGYFSAFKTRVFILIEQFLALFSTRIIAISKRQKRDLIRFKIAPAHKICVIPLGFDFSRILPIDPDARLRKQLQIPDEKIVIAIIGRITQIKNHALFFRIAFEVLKHSQNVHFLVIGDGELRQESEAETRRLGISDNVSFTGFITDLKLIYGSVDMVLLTSLNEGTPVSLLEAMACGKIVLTTNVGGVADFIDHGVNGFYFGFDADSFKDLILDYVANPQKYQAIGQQAALDILLKYDKQRLFRDIETLYE